MNLDKVRAFFPKASIGDDGWFVYDTLDNTREENTYTYFDIQEDLIKEFGLRLSEPYIEHNCISGKLIYNDHDILSNTSDI
jgi:hypothetical protein